jgi:hypothetical protein
VGKCNVLLVLIGDQRVSLKDSAGRRRLDNPDDFVRREVAEALQRDNITVIPVLVEGAAMPAPEDLPDELKDLSRRNAKEISDTRWDYDVGELVKELGKHCELAAVQRGATVSRAKVALAAGVAAIVAAGLAGAYLLPGRGVKGSQASASVVTATPEAFAAAPEDKEEIKEALALVDSAVPAADDMLEMLTNPDYDPRRFPKDRKRIETVTKELEDATDKYNDANNRWRNEQHKLELLMSRRPVVNETWRGAQKAITDYLDCVYELNEDKSNGKEPGDNSKVCRREKKNAEEEADHFTASLKAPSH